MIPITISVKLKSSPKNPEGIQFECHKSDKTSLCFWARGPENVKVKYQIVGDGVSARFCEDGEKKKEIERPAILSSIFPTKVTYEATICSDDCIKEEETFEILASIEEVGNRRNRNNTCCVCSYTIIDTSSKPPESAAKENSK